MVTAENQTTYCGALVQNWRTRRKLSRQTAATAIGISPSTISNWENGRFLPRLPELLALMEYLRIPALLQQEAIRQLQRPRAIQWLDTQTKEEAFVQQMGLPPSPHDLLRGLRLRAGMSIDEAAHLLSISRRTLLRWENGDTWPDDASLHTLCHVFNAHPDEISALSRRQLTMGVSKSVETMTLDELEDAYRTFRQPPNPPEKMALAELTYLSLAAAVWPYARYSEMARELLFNIYAELGSYHALNKRARPAQVFLDRALAYLKNTPRFMGSSALVIARAAYVLKTPTASRNLIETYLPYVATHPDQHSWLLTLIGSYYLEEGDHDACDAFSCRSVLVAERADPNELMLRRFDRASVLIDLGRPHDAFPLLQPIGTAHEPTLPLAWARAAAANGDKNDAHTYFQRASELALIHSQKRADVSPFITQTFQTTLNFLDRH